MYDAISTWTNRNFNIFYNEAYNGLCITVYYGSDRYDLVVDTDNKYLKYFKNSVTNVMSWKAV